MAENQLAKKVIKLFMINERMVASQKAILQVK